ncbi:MAG: hypothetical protein J5449_10960 [Oscillospiraceae bacterium]|nr:hypothetical protein [Oscillospiraceae bacterium]
MEQKEIIIGNAIYEIDRVYSEKQKLTELIRERIEKEAAVANKEMQETVA